MGTPQGAFERWRRAGTEAWAAIGVLVLLWAALWALGRIWGALVPFVMAAVIVFLLRGPVAWFERRGVPRPVSVLIAYLVAIVVVAVTGLFVFPLLVEQFAQFASAFPGYYTQASLWVADVTARYWALAPEWARQAAASLQQTVTGQLGEWAKSLAAGTLAAGGSLAGMLLNGVLAVFIAFYVLVDLPTIRRELLSLARPRWRPEAEVVAGKISTVVGGFLRGQGLIALANGTLTAFGLWLVSTLILRQSMPYWGILGLITGVLSVVPYVGPLVGGVIVGITGLFVSWQMALIGLLVMVGVQQVEGNVLSPKIMSDQVDLHPALVIFSLLAGAELGGLLGMLVSIPLAATGKALFVYYYERHTDEDISTVDGALFREAAPKKRAPSARNPKTTDEEQPS